MRLSASHGILGYVATSGRSLRIDNVADDPRYEAASDELWVPAGADHGVLCSALCVPVLGDAAIRGDASRQVVAVIAATTRDMATSGGFPAEVDGLLRAWRLW